MSFKGDLSKPMVNKLKEGLQEAVVFLRTLASYKIPAVIERRRQELLDKLCLLQGDTIKVAPPIIDPEEKTPPIREAHEKSPLKSSVKAREKSPLKAPEKDDEENEDTPSASSSAGTTPSHKLSRRDSNVNTLVKDFEHIHHFAKQEEESETPKRLFQLKKVAKPEDFPTSPTHSIGSAEEGEGVVPTEPAAKDTAGKGKDADKLVPQEDSKMERASSVASGLEDVDTEEGQEEEEKETGKKKKKSKRPFGSGLKVKGFTKKRDKSPGPERRHTLAAEEPDGSEGTQKEEAEVVEEGVRISGTLERSKKKGLGGYKKVKVEAKVKNTFLILGGKEELDLAHCTVEETETGFELVHPQHRSGMTFKVEEGEEEKQKWIAVLKEAITEATPPEEEKEEAAPVVSPQHEVPSITVDEVTSVNSKSNKRESKALTAKPDKSLPDKGVALKGFIHRKKPGLTKSWEKTYCVLTYQALYFTSKEDKKDYSNMLAIYPDTEAKLSEIKKGHDKRSQVTGLLLKLGKKVEQFSFDSQTDFSDWKDAIERVLGIGGVEELHSEDEELDGASIEEDLYEELETDYTPPVPASPRPSRGAVPPVPQPAVPQPAVPQEDDFFIDEDIYEDTDDILPSMPVPPIAAQPVPSLPNRNPQPAPSLPNRNPQPAPSLPDRNPPKIASPPPSLPSRSAGTPSKFPNLPPRNSASKPAASPSPVPTSSVGKKLPAVKPPIVPSESDEELYDDVLVGDGNAAEIEETYDDVVVPGESAAVEEDLYDDVVPITTGTEAEEFYEDMAPGELDSYVTMEMKGEEEEDLYVDVDEPPVHNSSISKKPPLKQEEASKSKTFSRMFQKKHTASEVKAGLSGQLSYKAPKKSKFDGRWAVIDGNNLVIYKTASDKRSQDKIALGECRLELGSTEAGAGKFAFHLFKGDKVHHFSFKEASQLEEWVDVVKGLVKYAPVEVKGGSTSEENSEQNVYCAKEDHIGETEGELTFKKGTFIRLITKQSSDVWVGQIGNEDQVFAGKIGQFPTVKVEPAEDLYI